MAVLRTILKNARDYPEILPVLGATVFACAMGTFMLVRNYNFKRVQWTSADPSLAIKPDENLKLWNTNPQTGGKNIDRE